MSNLNGPCCIISSREGSFMLRLLKEERKTIHKKGGQKIKGDEKKDHLLMIEVIKD